MALKNAFRPRQRPAPDEPHTVPTRDDDHFSDVTARCPICLERAVWHQYWAWVEITDAAVIEHLQAFDLKVNLPPNQKIPEDRAVVPDGATWAMAVPIGDVAKHPQRPAWEATPSRPSTLRTPWVLLDPKEPVTRRIVEEGIRLQVLTADNIVRVCPSEPSLRGRRRDAALADKGFERFRHGDVEVPAWQAVPAALAEKGTIDELSKTKQDLFPGYRVDPKSRLHHVPLAYGNGWPIFLIPVLGDSQAGKSSWILQLDIEPGLGFSVDCGNGVRIEFTRTLTAASIRELSDRLGGDPVAREKFFTKYYFGTETSHGAHLLLDVEIWKPGKTEPLKVRLLLADFAGEALRKGQDPWGDGVMRRAMEFASGVVFLRTAADLVYEVDEPDHLYGRPKILKGARSFLQERTIPAVYVVSQADRIYEDGVAQPLVQGLPRANMGGDPEKKGPASLSEQLEAMAEGLVVGPQDAGEAARTEEAHDDAAARAQRAIAYAATSARHIVGRKALPGWESVRQRRRGGDHQPLYGVFNFEKPAQPMEEVIHANTVALGGLVMAALNDGDLQLMAKSRTFDPYSIHALSAKGTTGLYEPLLALLHHMNLT